MNKSNQDKSIIEKTNKVPISDMAISIITVAELQFGAFNSNKIRENLERIKHLKSIIKTMNLTTDITEEYARIKSKLRKSGAIIDDFDILIGATAIINDMTLVTNNQQHFTRIDDIRIENWK